MFSSAFAIVLIDSIIPATEGQWGVNEAFSVFEHLISRGMAPAVVYQEHLIEMNDFRMNLKRRKTCNIQLCDNKTSQEKQAGLIEAESWSGHKNATNTHLEQDSMWSWMTTDNDLTMYQPDAIEAAILGLNHDSMGASLDFEAGNQWLWGDYVPEISMN